MVPKSRDTGMETGTVYSDKENMCDAEQGYYELVATLSRIVTWGRYKEGPEEDIYQDNHRRFP